jgi:hypothetical protein
MECTREDLARGLASALAQHREEEMNRSDLLNLRIPASPAEVEVWQDVVEAYREPGVEAAMREALQRLDTVVGQALGLTPEFVGFIQQDLMDDPFLRGIRHRYPGTVTRKQGFRSGLDATDRYM